MTEIFKTLELEAFKAGITPRTKQSREWFRKKISTLRGKEFRRINQGQLMQEEELTLNNATDIGKMCMFFYDPKHKDTLPFYDSFPLVIIIGKAKGGFLGMNLHYLPPVLRAKMLDGLMANANEDDFNVTYKVVKAAANMRYYKPCVKHYLKKHLRSKLAKVHAPEWEIATFLPTASWNKASGQEVYKQSRAML
tara:strand:- start:2677 stop:3258 length:582 start_codon:yes stop_codon:yes gene_type:complete